MPETKITVTEPIIERACQRDSRHCMVAEAIQAEKPAWRNISVDLQTIRWTNPRTRTRYTALTPEPVGRAIVAFDRGEPVEPFDVTLRPVHRVKTKKAKAEQSRQRRNPTVKSSGSRVVVEGGRSLPRGHLGGSASGQPARSSELTTTPEGNVQLSGGRYRQYGLRQLRD